MKKNNKICKAKKRPEPEGSWPLKKIWISCPFDEIELIHINAIKDVFYWQCSPYPQKKVFLMAILTISYLVTLTENQTKHVNKRLCC